MKEIKALFRNVEKMLKQARWYDDDWEIYNRGPYLQLYKSTWFNQSQQGVHFETYIEAPQIKQKVFPICVHAEQECPEQLQFMQKLIAVESRQIQSWKGYTIIGEGYQVCQKNLPLNFKNLEQRMFEEFNQLRKLAATIDLLLPPY